MKLLFTVIILLLSTSVFADDQTAVIEKFCPGLLDGETKYSTLGLKDSYHSCTQILIAKKELLGLSQEISEVEKQLAQHSKDKTKDVSVDDTNPLNKSDELFIIGLSGFENERVAKVLYKGVARRVSPGEKVGPYIVSEIDEGHVVASKGAADLVLYTMSMEEIKQHLGISNKNTKPQQGIPVLTSKGLGKVF